MVHLESPRQVPRPVRRILEARLLSGIESHASGVSAVAVRLHRPMLGPDRLDWRRRGSYRHRGVVLLLDAWAGCLGAGDSARLEYGYGRRPDSPRDHWIFDCRPLAVCRRAAGL